MVSRDTPYLAAIWAMVNPVAYKPAIWAMVSPVAYKPAI
jgi:hypothetical protein